MRAAAPVCDAAARVAGGVGWRRRVVAVRPGTPGGGGDGGDVGGGVMPPRRQARLASVGRVPETEVAGSGAVAGVRVARQGWAAGDSRRAARRRARVSKEAAAAPPGTAAGPARPPPPLPPLQPRAAGTCVPYVDTAQRRPAAVHPIAPHRRWADYLPRQRLPQPHVPHAPRAAPRTPQTAATALVPIAVDPLRRPPASVHPLALS